eukprot:CAMPEP_0197664362 /NCGR_PEP_ID=MMETSP1338-20131121/58587_1 /TAXON_ID=43686 ORGANISM="Pelagodinium beii, Strain RCC1491" /NCGR_SAMPLE_ID=MMETSP1338 /ASSEMBLY_ACC=CAM_ASM_000754 /LENGTH=431 /DNA_ID=CAMNT_0043242979 /DNA_START=106 /DNA_END=1401 /DNA_ORIENTATION=+
MNAFSAIVVLLTATISSEAVSVHQEEAADSTFATDEKKGRLMRTQTKEESSDMKLSQEGQLANEGQEPGNKKAVFNTMMKDYYQTLMELKKESTVDTTTPWPIKVTSGISNGTVIVVNGTPLPPNFIPLSVESLNAAQRAVVDAALGNPCASTSTLPPAPCVHTTTPLPPCEFGAWSEWSQCSTTCGPGISERHRKKIVDVPCVGSYKEELDCGNDSPCPTPCPESTTTTTPAPIIALGPQGEIMAIRSDGSPVPCEPEPKLQPKQLPKPAPIVLPIVPTHAPPEAESCQVKRTRAFYKELMKSHYKAIMDSQPCKSHTNAITSATTSATTSTETAAPTTTTSMTPCVTMPECDFQPWSDWGECSVTCGKGVTERHRLKMKSSPCIGAYKEELECTQVECQSATITTAAPSLMEESTKSESVVSRMMSAFR